MTQLKLPSGRSLSITQVKNKGEASQTTAKPTFAVKIFSKVLGTTKEQLDFC